MWWACVGGRAWLVVGWEGAAVPSGGAVMQWRWVMQSNRGSSGSKVPECFES